MKDNIAEEKIFLQVALTENYLIAIHNEIQ